MWSWARAPRWVLLAASVSAVPCLASVGGVQKNTLEVNVYTSGFYMQDMLISSSCARPLAGLSKNARAANEVGRGVFPPSRVRLTHPTNCDGYTERTVSTRRVRSREPCNGRQRHVHRFAPKCQGSSTLPRPPVAERSRQAGQPASLQPDHFDKQHSQLSLSSLLREQKFQMCNC